MDDAFKVNIVKRAAGRPKKVKSEDTSFPIQKVAELNPVERNAGVTAPQVTNPVVSSSTVTAPLRQVAAQRKSRMDQEEDWSTVPKEYVPDGYIEQWFTTMVMGMPVEPYKFVRAKADGWIYATRSEHPDLWHAMMPEGHSGNTIERAGQILMLRDKRYHVDARSEEEAKAKKQLIDKERELGLRGSVGAFDSVRPEIRKSYEALEVPPDA